MRQPLDEKISISLIGSAENTDSSQSLSWSLISKFFFVVCCIALMPGTLMSTYTG